MWKERDGQERRNGVDVSGFFFCAPSSNSLISFAAHIGSDRIDAEVVEASNRTEYTTFTKHAFEQLGGVADDGELAVEFWFK